MRKTATKIIFVILFISCVFAGYSEGIGNLEIEAVRGSGSSSAVNPAEYAVDNNELTSWRLEAGATDGWFELDLGAVSSIYGIEISGSLNDGVELGLKYEAAGIWYPFSPGSADEPDAYGVYIDVSGDRVKTERIRLYLNGEDASYSSIEEVKITGESGVSEYRKIEVDGVDGEDNMYYPLSNLTDGNTRSYWKESAYSGYFNMLQSTRAWLETCFDNNRQSNTGNRRHNDGGVIFSLPEKSKVYRLKVYLEEDYEGFITLEGYHNRRWEELGSLEEGLTSGWHVIVIENGFETESVKLVLSDGWGGGRYGHGNNWNTGLGGIGEVEFWGVSEAESGPESLINLEGVSLAETINKQFDVEELKNYTLNIVLDQDAGDEFAVEINGTEFSLNRVSSAAGEVRYETELDAEELWDEENFLRIPAQGSETELVGARISERKEDGILDIDDGAAEYFTGDYSGYKEFVFDEEVSLENISLFAEAMASECLYYKYEEQWYSLDWSGEYDHAKRFSIYENSFGENPGIKADSVRIENIAAGREYGIKIEGSLETDRAPEIRMYWPENGEVLERSGLGSMFAAGYIDDEDAEVTINGTAAQQIGNLFWVLNMPGNIIGNEDNELTIVATDQQGRVSEKTITWYDQDSPQYSVDLPEETIYTLDSTLNVEGRIQPNVSVFVNGEEAETDRRRYSKEVELEPGLNLIVIKFVHEHRGIVAMLQRRVVLVTDEPEIEIVSPEDNYFAPERALNVSGSFDVMGSYRISCGRYNVETSGSTFNIPGIRLQDGSNEITVTLRDQFGRVVRDGINVNCDTEAPSVTGVTPESGSLLSESVNTFVVTVEDASEVTVFLDGLVVPGGSGTFEKTIELPDGFPDLPLVVKDRAGNLTNESLSYTVDTHPPLEFDITVTPPGWTSDTRPYISFATTDEVSGVDHYELSLDNGDFYTVESPYQLPELVDGVHTLVVRAIDAAGHIRTSGAETKIDTIPPVELEDIEIVPGNGLLTLKWEDGDDDVIAYEIKRSPAWDTGEQIRTDRSDGDQEYIDTEVDNGSTYEYSIRAVDRAENKCDFSEVYEAVPGVESQEIEESGVTKAEYETAVLYLKGESLPSGAASVRIAEADPQWQEEADEEFEHDFVGAVYDFSLLDNGGEKTASGELFSEPYIGVLEYDPELIPDGYAEENISVYTFDERWGRWVRIEDSAVDPENNRVVFTSRHFSMYGPAATSVEDLSPEEIADAGYSPFGTYVNHEGFTVSPQGGNAHTGMTEFLLSGPNGFDFELKRYYDLSVAKMDTRADIPSWAAQYLENQGDYAYSMGNGWRLNLPYIKNAASEQYLVMPDGSMFGFESLELTNTPDTEDSRTLSLENHNAEHFSLSVTQEESDIDVYFIGAEGVVEHTWDSTEYILTLSNGTAYTMDGKGRTTGITSPDTKFTITVNYVGDGYELDYIVDAVGRVINFDYSETTDDLVVPYITEISLGDSTSSTPDPYSRSISYTQNADGYLTSAVDVGGRVWNYEYDNDYYVGGASNPVPFNLTDALEDYTDDSDLYNLIEALAEPTSDYTYKPLYSIGGPGKGRIEVTYGGVSGSEDGESYSRVVTRQVTVFNDNAAGSNDSIRATWYDYSFAKATDYDTEDDLSQGFYLSETVVDELNDNRYTKYSYGQRKLVDTCWSEDDDGAVNNETVDDKENAGNRIASISWYEKINNDSSNLKLLKKKSLTYTEDTDISPETEEITHGSGVNNKIERSFEYDSWGNRIKTEETIVSSGRTRKNVTWREFSTNEEPEGAGFASYENSGLENNYTSSGIRNLPVKEKVENYSPAINSEGNVGTSIGTAINQYTYYSYDTLGRITGKSIWDSSNNGWNKTSYSWNNSGDMNRITDANEHVTVFTYDSLHYPETKTEESVKDEDGATKNISWSYDYDWAGWKRSETEPRTDTSSYTTTTTYDKLGRVTSQSSPGDDGETYIIYVTYTDTLGSLSSTMTDTMGRTVTRKYNDLGQMVKQSSYLDTGEAAVVELSYDRWGNVVEMINPNAGMIGAGEACEYTTYYDYNALGRLERIDYPYESDTGIIPSKSMEYDYETNTLTIEDEEGNITTELHDMRGNVIKRTQVVDEETITTLFWYDGLGNLVAQKGPVPAAVLTNTYNSLNQLVSVKLPEETFYENGSSVTVSPLISYSYDELGRQEEEVKSAPGSGERVTLTTWDELGQKIRVEYKDENASLAEEKFYYDDAGNLKEYVDPNGAITGYTYTPRNNVETQTDPEGGVTSYEYYADGLVKSAIDPRGNSGNYSGIDFEVTYNYDNLKRLTSVELPAKEEGGDRLTMDFEYDLLGNLIKQTGADGLVTTYDYNPRRRLETQSVTGDGKSYVTTNEYDKTGNIIKTTDPRGNYTVMDYDEAGQLVYKKSAEYDITRFDYDEAGNLTETTWTKDGIQVAARYEYDAYGRLLTQYLPVTSSNTSTEIEKSLMYDRLGNLSIETDALGNSTYYSYDGLNRLTEELNDAGFSRNYEYDDGGRLTKSTDANGSTSSYSYDKRGLLLQRSISGAGDSKLLKYSYDEAGGLEWAEDDGVFTGYNGAESSYTPDVYGRIKTVVTTLGGRSFETGYEYNSSDMITGVTAPDGNKVNYEYSLLGEITDVAGYLSGSPAYDEGGLITSITAANGVSLTLDYDKDGRMTGRTFSGQQEGDAKGYELSYDEAGNIRTITSAAGDQNIYTYDLRNQLTNAVLRGNFGVEPEDTEQEAMAIEADDVTGEGSLEEVDGAKIISLDFAAGSIGMDLNGSYKVARIYMQSEADSRVKAEHLRVFLSDDNAEGSYAEQEGFTVDETAGGGFEIILKRPESAAYVKVMTDFNERDVNYDPIDKSGFKASASGIIKVYHYVSYRREQYGYDNAGNRTSKKINYIDFTDEDTTYKYYEHTNRLMTDGEYAYQYDANGNITAKGTVLLINDIETLISDITDWNTFTDSTSSLQYGTTGELWEYEYDLLNRLIEVSKNGTVVASYTYNADGLRIKKEKDGEARYYIFDLNGNVLYEESSDESYTKYVYIKNTRFAREDGSTDGSTEIERYYYHTDHLGSTVMVTDKDANVVWDSEYTPFGELNDPYKKDEGMVQFTGKDMDFDTGLYYYNARWYDPNLGRFTTEDPIRDGLNWFIYANNNPLKFVDPTGLITVIDDFAGKIITEYNYDGSPERRSTLMTAQYKVMENPNYVKGAGGPYHLKVSPKTTWCNQAAFDVIEATGNTIGGDRDWMSANEFAERASKVVERSEQSLVSPENITLSQVSPEKAQELANNGFTVTGAWQNPLWESGQDDHSGHIVTVLPSDSTYDPELGPMVANVGERNDVMYASDAFGVNTEKPDTASSLSEISYYYNPNQFGE